MATMMIVKASPVENSKVQSDYILLISTYHPNLKMTPPSYLKLHKSSLLKGRIKKAVNTLSSCTICPHKCRVNRLVGELGICRVGSRARVSSFGPHFGEESPLVGQNGSGTIFFEGCNLLCLFCQNSDISHIDRQGDESPQAISDEQLADIMLSLQQQGCHNINFVTPSHVVPQILSALPIAIDKGLNIPLVYNTGGYDSIQTLKLLEGVIDIYMPDCKFITAETAKQYTKARDYPDVMKKAVREMYRQVSDLEISKDGLAVRGLLVRHLVMPGHLEETASILDFLAQEISTETYLNIMDQYRPCYKAFDTPPINRSLSSNEYSQAVNMAKQKGLNNLDQRDWKKLMKLLGL